MNDTRVRDAGLWDRTALRQFFEEEILFNRHLGIRVVEMGEGDCEIMLPVHENLIGDPFRPALHGGVLSALADAAGGLAVFTRLDRGDLTSTVDLRIDYLRPASVQGDLRARARIVRMGNRVAATDCEVFQSSSEETIALVRAVYNVVRRDG